MQDALWGSQPPQRWLRGLRDWLGGLGGLGGRLASLGSAWLGTPDEVSELLGASYDS